MTPYYVCQLPQEEQDHLREKIRFVLLHECGNDPAKAPECFGSSLEDLIQDGMDSKVDDLFEIHRLYDEIMRGMNEEAEDEYER